MRGIHWQYLRLALSVALAPWYDITFKVKSDVLSLEELGSKLGIPAFEMLEDHWSIDLSNEDNLIRGVMPLLQNFIATNQRVLANIPGVKTMVFIGWSPRSGQDFLEFPEEFLELLATIGGSIQIHSYIESPEGS